MTQTYNQSPPKSFSQELFSSENQLLTNKIAIITGSNKGIGEATARIFARHGAKVIINGRNERDCKRVADNINTMGGTALPIVADITKEKEVENLFQEVIGCYGSIDILVNNAGTSRDKLIHKMEDQDLSSILDINLKAAHLCTQAVLPYFRLDRRRNEYKKIINLSSITGITGNFGQANYGMAKAGLIAYSKACAREFSRDRINVNVIAPGFTETQMTQVKHPGQSLGMPEPIRNLAINCTPFTRDGHAGQPHHIAGGILFFASPLSNWVTGQILVIGGGMYV